MRLLDTERAGQASVEAGLAVKLRAAYSGAKLAGALDDEDAKELFAHFGLAIHVANILEFGMLQALFVLEIVPRVHDFKTLEEWGSAHDNFFVKGFKQTYGDLLIRLDKTAKVSAEMMLMLSEAKRTRNHLVHHFQRQSADVIFSSKGRIAVIEACNAAVGLFNDADKRLYAELAPIRQELGVDDAWFEKRVREQMDEFTAVAAKHD